jgi:Serine protease Clip domain PPAF-2
MKPTASFAQSNTNFIVNNSTAGVCICVTTGSCALASGGGSSSTSDGSGIIDIRIINVRNLSSSNILNA